LGNPYVLTQFVGFIIFMIAIQAELTQAPFDMPIAESELVSGYMTEYSGFRFLMFFIGEFATAGVFALIASVLFLGGWGVPFAWFGWDSLDEVADWALVEAVHYAADDRPFSRRMTGLVELSGATGEVLERLHASGARPPLHTLGLVEPIQPAQWGPALNGVKTLRLERFDSWGRHDAEPWTRLSQWNQLETFEIWFSMNGESADGWNDDRGSRALTAFRPLLGPNTTLRVGYQLGNGARGGVVAVLKGQELALESAGFAGPRAQKAAEASLSGAGAKALPPEQSAPTASKTGWRKLLARFGF
jgi:hypothetical protein